MNNEILYQTIFKRKSIRKYDMTPLSAEILENIQKFADQDSAIDETIKYECVYLGSNIWQK